MIANQHQQAWTRQKKIREAYRASGLDGSWLAFVAALISMELKAIDAPAVFQAAKSQGETL